MGRTYTTFEASVVEVRPLGPHLTEIAFGGPDLASFGTGGLDQRIKLLLPRDGRTAPELMPPDGDWYADWLAMPHDTRPVMRTYTAMSVEDGVVRIWIYRHGDSGPGSAWAARAAVGDRVGLVGPVVGAPAAGVEWSPGADTDRVLLAGDETALPAIAAIVAQLPAGQPGHVRVEVDGPEDEIPLPTAADLDVRWVHRPAGLAAAVAEVELPGRPYCWVAGEATFLKAARRHLRTRLGLPRDQVYLGGYWRRGHTEDDG